MQKQIQKLSWTLAMALIMLGGFFVFQMQAAQAAVDPYINFQGKMVSNTDGTNVSNASHTFLFCLYTTSTPATACTAGANNDAIWRESKSITTVDGIFQTNLGSTTALPAAATFNTAGLYLGINFDSNGQMTPLVEFTASPYAFNAEKLQGGDWATPGAIGTGTAAAGTFTNLSTTTGGLSIAAGQSYTGAGAITLSSGGTNTGLTINSSGTGTIAIGSDTDAETINIGTGGGVKTLVIGSLNTTSGVTIQSGTTGTGIGLQANGTATGNVQIGDGGAASATPDLLVLDIGSAEPTGGIGSMYYSTALNKFRCYQNAGWTDCIGTGGAQTPWAQDVSAAGYDLGSLSNLGFQETTAAPTSTDVGFYRDNAGDLSANVLTGKSLNLAVNGTDEYNFSSTGLAFNSNNITGLGANLTATAGLSIASTGANALNMTGGAASAWNIGANALSITSSNFNTTATGINSTVIGATTAAAGTFTGLTTTTGGVSIAANQSYTGAGAVTLSSGGTNTGLTMNSAGTGAINMGSDTDAETITIGTGGGIKTLSIGSLNTSSVTNIQSGTAGINLQVAGIGATGAVQIGAGTGANDTPDFLSLDSKLSAGDPAGGTVGDMYYNVGGAKFRCFEGAGWKDCDTGGSTNAAGADNQIQFNDGGTAFGGDADFAWDKTGNKLSLPGVDTGVTMAGITNEPASPAAGNLTWYSKLVAGRMMPKWKAPSGVDTSFQSSLAFNTINMWSPSLTATGNGIGTTWVAGTGTFLNVLPTDGMGMQMRRSRFTNIVTTTNQILGITNSTAASIPSFYRGSAAGRGGFFFQTRFTTELVPATTIRLFAGLTSMTTGASAADTVTGDVAGLSHITTDGITTFAFMTRDNVTTNRVTFTAPAIASGNAYDFTMYVPPNGSAIYYRLVDLLTGNVIVDSSTSANLPRNTVFMGPQVQMSNGTANVTVTTTAIGINKIYIESDM